MTSLEIPKFVSFAVDPGSESGWGIALIPEFVAEFGTASTINERKSACERAKIMAEDLNLPLVATVEEWTIGGPRVNHKMLIGLGKSYGRWLDHIELILGISEDDIVRATPQKWRNGLFGSKLVKKYTGNSLKALACAYLSPSGSLPVKNHNAAEAGCIACWAHCSEEGVIAGERAWRIFKRESTEFEEDNEELEIE